MPKTSATKSKRSTKIAVPKRAVETPKGLQVTVVGVDGKAKGKMQLPTELFGAKVNKQLLAQSVRVYLANQRAGAASTKTRGEVEGSTRKIYKQKGTGRARHGAIRAPIFVGGGIVFGPKPRDYSLSFPKKMKRAALASALTAQLVDGKVTVVDGLESLPPKTKAMAKTLNTVAINKPLLLVIGKDAPAVVRGTRNIDGVDVLSAQNLYPYAILTHAQIVFMKQAIPILKETFVKGDV